MNPNDYNLNVTPELITECLQMGGLMSLVWGDVTRNKLLIMIFFMKREWYEKNGLYDKLRDAFVKPKLSKKKFEFYMDYLVKIKLIETITDNGKIQYKMTDMGDTVVRNNEFIKNVFQKQIKTKMLMDLLKKGQFSKSKPS